jgi:hypothetical protein
MKREARTVPVGSVSGVHHFLCYNYYPNVGLLISANHSFPKLLIWIATGYGGGHLDKCPKLPNLGIAQDLSIL